MQQIKLALIREGKIPAERRVPLTPGQVIQVQQQFPHVKIFCQQSDLRCFKDQAYRDRGIEVVEDISGCDILMGIKEVPVATLIPHKTYLFFSHTTKKQPQNRSLLQAILDKNIRLIDYERLTDAKGRRIVAFGRFAGIVGAYNALYYYGKKYHLYDLRRAKDCYNLLDLKKEYKKIKLPPVKIALTGGGRVAKGAMEVLDSVGVRKIGSEEYLRKNFNEPVYTQLGIWDYNRKKDGAPFTKQEFYKFPERFGPGFLPFTRLTDIFIAGAYWDSRAPVLFHREDMLRDDFRIRVIADIACDIEGPIPAVKKISTIDNPVYDYDPQQDIVFDQPFLDKNLVSIMAVDNLPSELPKDASRAFGEKLVKYVLPDLLGEDAEGIIKRATVTEKGQLTEDYQYLQDYVRVHIS